MKSYQGDTKLQSTVFLGRNLLMVLSKTSIHSVNFHKSQWWPLNEGSCITSAYVLWASEIYPITCQRPQDHIYCKNKITPPTFHTTIYVHALDYQVLCLFSIIWKKKTNKPSHRPHVCHLGISLFTSCSALFLSLLHFFPKMLLPRAFPLSLLGEEEEKQGIPGVFAAVFAGHCPATSLCLCLEGNQPQDETKICTSVPLISLGLKWMFPWFVTDKGFQTFFFLMHKLVS